MVRCCCLQCCCCCHTSCPLLLLVLTVFCKCADGHCSRCSPRRPVCSPEFTVSVKTWLSLQLIYDSIVVLHQVNQDTLMYAQGGWAKFESLKFVEHNLLLQSKHTFLGERQRCENVDRVLRNVKMMHHMDLQTQPNAPNAFAGLPEPPML